MWGCVFIIEDLLPARLRGVTAVSQEMWTMGGDASEQVVAEMVNS